MSKEKKLFILETAVRMFAERSYDVVSIRELSSAAGVNDATLYYYFKSKEGILEAIVAHFVCKLKSVLITPEQIDDWIEKDTPAQLLEKVFPRFEKDDIQFILYTFRIMYMEQFTYPPAQAAVTELSHKALAQRFEYALNKLVEHGKISKRDTQMLSTIVADVMYARLVMALNDFSQVNSDCFQQSNIFDAAGFLIDMALA